MATYGRGQMLGSGINPESFKQDYSGFARAAETQAQGMANLGASIGGVIKDFGEAKKEQKKVDAYNKASVKAIEAAITLGGSYGITGAEDTLRPFLEAYNDPNLSPIEKAALLDEGKGMIPNVFGRFDASQADAIQRAQLDAAENEAKARNSNRPMTLTEIAMGRGKQQAMLDPITGIAKPIILQGFEDQSQQGVGVIDLVKGFEKFEPKAYNDYKQTSVGYGTKGKPGEVLTEEQASERLQSELFGHAKRIEDAAALKGITLNKNQFNALTSFDFNTGKGANLIERFGDNPQQLASKILEYNKAGGEVKKGLVKRRQIEAALFLSPDQQAAATPQSPTQNQGRIGFIPAKAEEKETFRPFTKEEIALYGSQGQVSSTGKVYPIRPSTGGRITRFNPETGQLEIIEGSQPGGKAEGVAKAQEQMKGESFRLNQSNTEEAFKRLDTAGTNNPVFAAGNALLAEALPASETGELAGFYERINSENSFIKMSQLRASSPTGGAAGTMTEKEWPRFEGRFSPLKVNAKKDTIAKSLSLNLLNAFEATNGTPDDIIKALDEKRIDQATYDNYVSDYVRNRQIARVNANGVEGESNDWTKLNKKLLSKSTIFEAPTNSGIELLPDEQQLIDKHKTK